MGDSVLVSVVAMVTCEGMSAVEASKDVIQVGVSDTSEHLCGIDGGVLSTQEAWVIAAVAKEQLLFETGIRIGECEVLGLEEWVHAFVMCDDIETLEEVVVG